VSVQEGLFIKVDLIVIVKGGFSGWGGTCDRQHHFNFSCCDVWFCS